MTIQEWIKDAESKLKEAGITEPRLDAQLLLSYALHQNKSYILAHPTEKIDPNEIKPLLDRRLKREPLSYILECKEFYSRKFFVGPGVLIPRPETEILIEVALDFIPAFNNKHVLDLGTGSGCIAITLKLERPKIEMFASDISREALVFARKNARQLDADVHFIFSDAFDGFPEQIKFDFIVSNPPYIELDYPLEPEILNYEPHRALYAGEKGLDFYNRLSQEAKPFLKEGGIMLLEHGYQQSEAIQSIFIHQHWNIEGTWNDLNDYPRVLAVSY